MSTCAVIQREGLCLALKSLNIKCKCLKEEIRSGHNLDEKGYY
jgi:hypothetical protein